MLEYALLVAIVAAAFLGMQYYMKRSIQGKIKQSADGIGEPYDSAAMRSSVITTNVNAKYTTNTTSKLLDAEANTYAIESNTTKFEQVTRTGNETLNPW